MVDRSTLLAFLFSLFVGTTVGNGCDRYVKCRNELLELHWKCSESSRRFTQHACKINTLYGSHKATAYNIESLFADCTSKYSAINEIDFLLSTDPACNSDIEMDSRPIGLSSATCWSDMMRLTQKCFAQSRCCPAAHRCAADLEGDVINEQFELEKSQMKLRLEECAVDMASVLRAPVSREDAMIARKVSEATKIMLRSVVPFKIYPDPQKKPPKHIRKPFKKPREFAALIRGTRRPFHTRPGISKPKYSAIVRAGRAEVLHAPLEPPTSSLSPFAVLHNGATSPFVSTTSLPPAFSPFSFQSIDFDVARNHRKVRRGKKRRHRKKKHDFESEMPFAQASKISREQFDAKQGAEKLDRLNGNVKQKGEYSMAILPKMLMVKQNKGRFLGYARPVARPLLPPTPQAPPTAEPITDEPKQSVDQIYDDILEAQIQEKEFSNSVEETIPTTDIETSSQIPPTSRLTFPPFRRTTTTETPTTTTTTTTTTESTTSPTTTTTTTTETTTMSTEEPTTTTTTEATTTTEEVTETSVDPLIDYITHELLEKHMEKPKPDEDELDFSNTDYIDISAMDIEPTTSTTASFSLPIARYEQENGSPRTSIWPIDGTQNPIINEHTTSPQMRTTAAPLSAGMLSEQQNGDLIPLPTAAQSFGSIDVTPSPSISTTPLEDQLWPLPIRKKHRLKVMGAKMLEKSKPIVILPMNKKNARTMSEYKRKFLKQTGCRRYEKCLRKEIEMRTQCARPYPTPYDQCSAQLLPLYRLIDEATNNKMQYFIRCVGDSREKHATCPAKRPISELEVTCENTEQWSAYCRQLEQCCPAKDRCDVAAEEDHVGSRLRLLEKSFSLRAAACQFKSTFHRSLVRKL